jgi:ComF family protein
MSRLCASCRNLPPAYDATVAAADYAAPLDRALTAFKFSGRIGLAPALGGLLADRWRQDGPPAPQAIDCLAPIPLSPGRLADRGFNQAHLIARAMLARLRARHQGPLPVIRPALLTRRRETPPQSLLQLPARQANLDHGFHAAGPLDGLRIGVIDDVMTTGATLQAAAIALKAAGARQVVNLVVARTA